MEEVAIGSQQYGSWANLGQASEYLAADEDKLGRALVTASRLLGKVLCIGGVKLDELDPATEIPEAIRNGTIVLANLIYNGSSVASSESTGSNIKRQRAGSVEVEYFNPTLLSDAGRWPVELTDLVGSYFCGGTGALGGVLSFGTCGCSLTEETFRPGYGAP
jgi:hypothetical protein